MRVWVVGLTVIAAMSAALVVIAIRQGFESFFSVRELWSEVAALVALIPRELILLIPLIGFFLVGLLVGRAWLLLLPAILWELLYLMASFGSYGLGDHWPPTLVGITFIGVAAVVLGLLSRRLLHQARLRGAGSGTAEGRRNSPARGATEASIE